LTTFLGRRGVRQRAAWVIDGGWLACVVGLTSRIGVRLFVQLPTGFGLEDVIWFFMLVARCGPVIVGLGWSYGRLAGTALLSTGCSRCVGRRRLLPALIFFSMLFVRVFGRLCSFGMHVSGRHRFMLLVL
jgi:hypothetical protein